MSDLNITDISNVPDMLRQMRIANNMTLREVSQKAGVDIRQYQRFESGERDLLSSSFITACRVIEALGMDISDFYHGKFIKEELAENTDDDSILELHKKAAILTKGKSPSEREKQVERIKERFPDIEIVKVYNATYTNIARMLDEMEEDAKARQFDLVLATNPKKFMASDEPNDTVDRVTRLNKAGVGVYFTQESYYYGDAVSMIIDDFMADGRAE